MQIDDALGGSGADIRFAVNTEKMRILANGSAQLGQSTVRATNGFTSFIDNTEASTAAAFSANNAQNDGYNY